MSEMDYDHLFDDVLHNVVQTVLARVAKEGLVRDHHFYISFRTGHTGVVIPDQLRTRYPDEMTIVLQNQFWDLKVAEDRFEVTLSFNDMQERVIVPFTAITSFVDPSVRFGMQFRGGKESESLGPAPVREKPEAQPEAARDDKTDSETASEPTEEDASAEVIPLDTFRKK